ncbi:xanthine dehydrogenase family protein molybdopterin-binding subunit, partial [Streptomyces sp. MCAF7]
MTTVEQTIGAPLTRVDGPQKVTGEALYSYEFPTPDITYVWPVQSTIARGRVTEVDASAALALPGVLTVLDSGSAPRLNADAEVSADLFVLQSPEVAYHGQIVAAVVATSLESAREAAAAVRLSYAPEPHDVVLRADDEAAYVPERVTDGEPGFQERGDVER